MGDARFAFAGDRAIAVRVLRYLLARGDAPVALLVPDQGRASHAEALETLLAERPLVPVLRGPEFRAPAGLSLLRSLSLDYVVSIHFPYLVPREALEIPRHGWLNLHPAFLPYNRGWHTATWALLDQTPPGGTLHVMSEDVDCGPIVHQKRTPIEPDDTADSLYRRVLNTEFEVFSEAWPELSEGRIDVRPQDREAGTTHTKRDLEDSGIQRIALDEAVTPRELLRKLRALTTNDPGEAAYYEEDGRRFRVQVSIVEDKPS